MKTITNSEGTFKVRTINKFVVTAYQFSKNRRAVLSQRISRKHAEQFVDRISYEMEISIEKYKFFTDIRIEPCKMTLK